MAASSFRTKKGSGSRTRTPGGSSPGEPPALDLFFVVEPEADRVRALAEMTKLRAAGVACDADYAGRSLKGQRTQLSRSGARGFVHVRADGTAIVKRDRDAPETWTNVADVAATVLA